MKRTNQLKKLQSDAIPLQTKLLVYLKWMLDSTLSFLRIYSISFVVPPKISVQFKCSAPHLTILIFRTEQVSDSVIFIRGLPPFLPHNSHINSHQLLRHEQRFLIKNGRYPDIKKRQLNRNLFANTDAGPTPPTSPPKKYINYRTWREETRRNPQVFESKGRLLTRWRSRRITFSGDD